ncbi:MAG: hypothetical protein CVU51_01265 [Deltaproteobacteria bacterium HGW-Deltaproteobacteria-1]|jgi:hypothetical protein|nr:MAG: hypothetical protein CVU51_01265 [Deltaproteobacteria bacterium HGW-Deltaproteobacteria-1]
MEEIKIIDPCTDGRWDNFVANHPFGWIVHLSGWKKVIEQTFPHMKAYYFALIDKDTNAIKAGLPIYEISSWLTGNRLVSIPFATLCDPLVSNVQQKEMLISEAIRLLDHLKFCYIEIRTLASSSLFVNKSYRVNAEYKHHYIDISRGEGAVWKNTSYKSIRYMINKAIKNNIQIKYAQNDHDLLAFYELYAETRKRLGLPAQPYIFFKGIFDQFKAAGRADILLACMNNKIIAGHLHLNFNGRLSVEAMGDDCTRRNIGASHYLYWQGIRKACAEEYKIFDFGRTSTHNPTLISFKRRWGTTEADLCTYYYDHGQKKVVAMSRETSMAYKLLSYLCQNAPKPVYPVLSRFCYRHLG